MFFATCPMQQQCPIQLRKQIKMPLTTSSQLYHSCNEQKWFLKNKKMHRANHFINLV